MGDASEAKFLEYVEGKCERFGLNRPEGIYVPHLPARLRAAPDYVQTSPPRMVECMGLGRGQYLQIKLEKWGVLRWWNDLMEVVIWVWDSHKKRFCLISLDALDTLIQTPALVEVDYFDGSKFVWRIPADALFSASDRD
jgi:hypothetical protein